MNETASQTSATTTQPSHEDITRRADELLEKYGRPVGRDEEIWCAAKRDLKGQSLSAAAAVLPVPADSPAIKTAITPKTAQSSGATAAAKMLPLRAPPRDGR